MGASGRRKDHIEEQLSKALASSSSDVSRLKKTGVAIISLSAFLCWLLNRGSAGVSPQRGFGLAERSSTRSSCPARASKTASLSRSWASHQTEEKSENSATNCQLVDKPACPVTLLAFQVHGAGRTREPLDACMHVYMHDTFQSAWASFVALVAILPSST